MAKVTSKLQVTIPKQLAERYTIAPGDEIEWQAAGDVIRVVPPGRLRRGLARGERLRLFDESTRRQQRRERAGTPPATDAGRGWTREELYERGQSR